MQPFVTKPLLTMPGKGMVPVVYRLNLRDPKGLFLAQAFGMKEGDMVFVAISTATEFAKVMQVFNMAWPRCLTERTSIILCVRDLVRVSAHRK